VLEYIRHLKELQVVSAMSNHIVKKRYIAIPRLIESLLLLLLLYINDIKQIKI
jgi:hypothetical protein